MKKILLSLLIVFSMFSMTACDVEEGAGNDLVAPEVDGETDGQVTPEVEGESDDQEVETNEIDTVEKFLTAMSDLNVNVKISSYHEREEDGKTIVSSVNHILSNGTVSINASTTVGDDSQNTILYSKIVDEYLFWHFDYEDSNLEEFVVNDINSALSDDTTKNDVIQFVYFGNFGMPLYSNEIDLDDLVSNEDGSVSFEYNLVFFFDAVSYDIIVEMTSSGVFEVSIGYEGESMTYIYDFNDVPVLTSFVTVEGDNVSYYNALGELITIQFKNFSEED